MPPGHEAEPDPLRERAPHIFMVCRTCARFAGDNGCVGETKGEQLAESIRSLWRDWAGAASFRMRVLTCLGGCPNPCNAALSGPGKWRLRIKQLTPSDAAALLELAAAYLVHVDGDLHQDEVPAPLRERISARTPPYEALLGSGSGAQ